MKYGNKFAVQLTAKEVYRLAMRIYVAKKILNVAEPLAVHYMQRLVKKLEES